MLRLFREKFRSDKFLCGEINVAFKLQLSIVIGVKISSLLGNAA